MGTLLSLTTPVNLEEEKRRFFQDITYHPQFIYTWETEAKHKMTSTFPEKQAYYDAIIEQDHQRIIESAINLFETDPHNQEVHKAAQEILEQKSLQFDYESVEKLQEAFQKALKFFSLGVKVRLSNAAGFFIRPNLDEDEMIISKHARMELFSVEGEVLHEMTHVIRHYNTRYNNILRARGYLPTEEGLATYMQDVKAKENKGARLQHTAEFEATNIGLKGSLRDVYNFLRTHHFSRELAWARAARHKFGFKNTEKPGDSIKPAMYFYHQRQISKLDNEGIVRLFVGKIRRDQLNSYPEYRGKWSEATIREFFRL